MYIEYLKSNLGSYAERLDFLHVFFLSVAVFLLSQVLLVVYRLTIHPLAKYPGPKLAAASYWYEYYYDVTKKGRYIWKIIDLHKQYGPIIRINPNEIHASDPTLYAEIYHSNKHITHRDPWFNLDFLGQALAFTLDHDLHALRRHAINPYFSMQSIRALEPRITTVTQHLLTRLSADCRSGAVINLVHIFAAFAVDVVTDYAFGKEGGFNLMAHPEYGKSFSDLTRNQVQNNNFLRQFKVLMWVFVNVPETVVGWMNPGFKGFLDWNNGILEQVRRILAEEGDDDETDDKGAGAGGQQGRTIFHELKNSDLPPREKGLYRLRDEANMVVGAGGETTAQTLARTYYHLLENRDVLLRLSRELVEALPDAKEMPSLGMLQNLPYLNAVVEEGVRISFPVPARSPRIFQDHALQYGEWTIEPGTAISMSPWMVTMNDKIFPEPFKFKPERWLDNKELQKYQVTFGKGRRACLGKNLAYAELLFAIAMMCRNFELELYETTWDDVDIKHDYFVALPKLDSKGVRAKVVKELS